MLLIIIPNKALGSILFGRARDGLTDNNDIFFFFSLFFTVSSLSVLYVGECVWQFTREKKMDDLLLTQLPLPPIVLFFADF